MILRINDIVLFIWQLPQNLAGLLILAINARNFTKTNVYSTKYYQVKHLSDCGISLGKYVIIDSDIQIGMKTIWHEKGHQKQSQYLGWLYLIIIGLPSLIGNILHRFIDFDYYSQPWEKWADKLGNVKR